LKIWKLDLSKIFIVLIISTLFSVFSYADSTQTERVENFVKGLNYGAAATMNDILFGCNNPGNKSPILTIQTLNMCLKCLDCSTKMYSFLGEGFLFVSEVWFQTFGSYRVNIINRKDNVIFIINSDHILMKPMPLPKDYL